MDTPSDPQSDPQPDPKPAEHDGASELGDVQSTAPRHGLLRYTVERVLLLLVVAGVLWLIGIRNSPLLLVALALVLSGFISMVVLNRSRDAASASVSGMFRRMNDRIDASARAEDDVPPAS